MSDIVHYKLIDLKNVKVLCGSFGVGEDVYVLKYRYDDKCEEDDTFIEFYTGSLLLHLDYKEFGFTNMHKTDGRKKWKFLLDLGFVE